MPESQPASVARCQIRPVSRLPPGATALDWMIHEGLLEDGEPICEPVGAPPSLPIARTIGETGMPQWPQIEAARRDTLYQTSVWASASDASRRAAGAGQDRDREGCARDSRNGVRGSEPRRPKVQIWRSGRRYRKRLEKRFTSRPNRGLLSRRILQSSGFGNA